MIGTAAAVKAGIWGAKAAGSMAMKVASLAIGIMAVKHLMPKAQVSSSGQHLHSIAQAQENERERRFRLHLQHEDVSRRIEEREWPVKLSPSEYGKLGMGAGLQPLVVIFIPPDLDDPQLSKEVAGLFEKSIREVVNAGYSPVDPRRPVIFLGDGWRHGAPRSETALYNLYHLAAHVPTAIIQLDRIGNELHLLVGQFNCGPRDMVMPPLAFQSASADVQGRVAELIREEGEQLRALADNGVDIGQLGRGAMINLALLDAEKRSGQTLDVYFQPNPQHFLETADIVEPALKLVVAGLADQFHLVRHGTVPLLPRLLPTIAAGLPSEIAQALTQQVLREYQYAYVNLAGHSGPRGAEMLLELAAGFAANTPDTLGLRNPQEATALLGQAVALFIADRKVATGTALMDYVRSTAARGKDLSFLSKLASVWSLLGRSDEATQLHALCVGIAQRGKSEPTEPTPDPFVESMKTMLRPEQMGA